MKPAHPNRGLGLDAFPIPALLCLLLGSAPQLVGCEEAAETYQNEMQAVVVTGTWRFQSMEGGTPNEQLASATRFDAELVLNSDDTFKFTSMGAVFRGTWRIEDSKVILHHEERDGQPYTANDVSLDIVGDELLLRYDDGKTLVFAEAK